MQNQEQSLQASVIFLTANWFLGSKKTAAKFKYVVNNSNLYQVDMLFFLAERLNNENWFKLMLWIEHER